MKASIAVSEQQVLKVLIYGDSGTGKTTWGALCPEPMILLTEPQGRQAIAAANPEAEIVFVRDYEHFYALLGEIQHARFVAGRGKVCSSAPSGAAPLKRLHCGQDYIGEGIPDVGVWCDAEPPASGGPDDGDPILRHGLDRVDDADRGGTAPQLPADEDC